MTMAHGSPAGGFARPVVVLLVAHLLSGALWSRTAASLGLPPLGLPALFFAWPAVVGMVWLLHRRSARLEDRPAAGRLLRLARRTASLLPHLVLTATGAALALGLVVFFRSPRVSQAAPDQLRLALVLAAVAAFVMLFLTRWAGVSAAHAGELLEERSMLGVQHAVRDMLGLTRVFARRLTDSGEQRVDAASLAAGDLVRVLPGDVIPADGVVVRGSSDVNQASVTGESLPVEVAENAEVYAGITNLTGSIDVAVRRTGAGTLIGRVARIVLEAQQSRAPIIRLTEKYARYYMPLVLMLAGAVSPSASNASTTPERFSVHRLQEMESAYAILRLTRPADHQTCQRILRQIEGRTAD